MKFHMVPTEAELLLPQLVNRCQAKTIYPFITTLYFIAKFVEMDDRTKFKDQTEEKIEAPVILINKFNVRPDKVEQFLKDWADDASAFNLIHPGFNSGWNKIYGFSSFQKKFDTDRLISFDGKD
jgi:hypothetical protein